MDYLLHNISMNLKRIRNAKAMSLDMLAEQTGVSKSMLAQIERGMANPSIGILGKIVNGLHVEFNDLICTPRYDSHVVSVADMVPAKAIEGQYKLWLCFPYGDNKRAEIYRLELAPKGVYASRSHGEKTKEYVSLIDGEAVIELKDNTQHLLKDQVFRFDSDQPHQYVNPLDERVSLIIFLVAGE